MKSLTYKYCFVIVTPVESKSLSSIFNFEDISFEMNIYYKQRWLLRINDKQIIAQESVLGRETEFASRAAGIDARFAPYFDMASACTGPIAKNIHGIDEYVEIPSILKVPKIFAMTVLNWCGYDE